MKTFLQISILTNLPPNFYCFTNLPPVNDRATVMFSGLSKCDRIFESIQDTRRGLRLEAVIP